MRCLPWRPCLLPGTTAGLDPGQAHAREPTLVGLTSHLPQVPDISAISVSCDYSDITPVSQKSKRFPVKQQNIPSVRAVQ